MAGFENHHKKGITIIMAIFAMLIMGVMALVLVSRTVIESRISVNQLYQKETLYGAEAFLERGIGALIDDASSPASQTYATESGYNAVVYLDPYFVEGYSLYEPDNACFYTHTNDSYAMFDPGEAWIYGFLQANNLLGARIKKVEIVLRYLNFYEEGLLDVYAGIIEKRRYIGTIPMTSTNNEFVFKYLECPSNVFNNWYKILNGNIWLNYRNSSYNFELDWVALRVTYSVDSLSEPWATGDFVSYPFELDRVQTIDKIRIQDEAGKININYAPKHLLASLFSRCGFGGDANDAAQDVVDYRNSKFFDNIEEIKSASEIITEARFNNIKNYITVHSWLNPVLYNPSGIIRAPININTAPPVVLASMFAPYLSSSKVDDLVTAITTRTYGGDPFTSMFSSYTYSGGGDTKCFATFVDGLGSPFDADDKKKIKEIVDGSFWQDLEKQTWYPSIQPTYEGCFYSNVYQIEARAKRKSTGTLTPSHVRLKEIVGFPYDYSNYKVSSTISLNMPTYYGETSPKPYWRQVFE